MERGVGEADQINILTSVWFQTEVSQSTLFKQLNISTLVSTQFYPFKIFSRLREIHPICTLKINKLQNKMEFILDKVLYPGTDSNG